jgi:hypothetical protein
LDNSCTRYFASQFLHRQENSRKPPLRPPIILQQSVADLSCKIPFNNPLTTLVLAPSLHISVIGSGMINRGKLQNNRAPIAFDSRRESHSFGRIFVFCQIVEHFGCLAKP